MGVTQSIEVAQLLVERRYLLEEIKRLRAKEKKHDEFLDQQLAEQKRIIGQIMSGLLHKDQDRSDNRINVEENEPAIKSKLRRLFNYHFNAWAVTSDPEEHLKAITEDRFVWLVTKFLREYEGTQMNNNSRDAEVMALWDEIEVVSSIECSACKVQATQYEEPDIAAEMFYNQGWRVSQNKVYCPKCYKTYAANTVKKTEKKNG